MSIQGHSKKRARKVFSSGKPTTLPPYQDLPVPDVLRAVRKVTGLSVARFCEVIGITEDEFREFTRKSRPKKISRSVSRRIFCQFGFREEYLLPHIKPVTRLTTASKYLASYEQKYELWKVEVKKSEALVGKYQVANLNHSFNSLVFAATAKRQDFPCRFPAFAVALEEALAELAEMFGLLTVIEETNAKSKPRNLPFAITKTNLEWGQSSKGMKKIMGYEASKHSAKLGSSETISQVAKDNQLPFTARNWRKRKDWISVPDLPRLMRHGKSVLVIPVSESEARSMVKSM